MIQTRQIKGVDAAYAVVDPRIDDINVAFKIGDTVKELGEGFDLAANFSYANDKTGVPIGRLVVDGKTVMHDVDKTVNRDELYMAADGSLHIGKIADPVWAIQGSPPLLKDGKNVIAAGVKRDRTGTDVHNRAALRTAVGLTVDRKLVILRTYDSVTLDELADIMESVGCIDALNGDGGGSSYLWPADDGWGRKLGAALTVKKGVEKPVSKKPVLIIDPGHGGKDPGASGNGIIEKDYTLKISLYQFERFKQLGIPVALTRSTDVYLDSDKRTDIVKDSGAKYCISNHLNAAGNADAAGSEVIHSIHNDGKLAHAFAEALKDAGQEFRRVFCRSNDGEDYYFMHRQTGNVSTNIIEYGFMTDAGDAARIKANWELYAEAVVRAFCSFIGHDYVRPGEAVKEGKGMFTDVPDSHPMRGSIEKAAKAKVLGGIGGGKFGLGQLVTREQLVVILDRLNLLEAKK